MLDYARAVSRFLQPIILSLQLDAPKGIARSFELGLEIVRCGFGYHEPPSILKPFLYVRWFYRGWKLAGRLKGISVIHAHGAPLNGVLACLLSRKLKAPAIITEHTGPFTKLMKTAQSRFLTKWALKKACIVLVVSENLRSQILECAIRPSDLRVSFNPVDTELFVMQENGKFRNSKNILFVSRLEPYKGGLRTLQAFDRIAKRYPQWRLTMVGDGPELPDIDQFITSHNYLQGRVSLKGQLSKPQIAAEMKRAEFCVFPSEHETFGLVAAEAMSAGLPVIVGKTSACIEFVDAESGIAVQPKDIGAIADAIEYLILNGGKYDRQKIRQKIVDRFSLPVFGERLNSIYQDSRKCVE